MSKEKSDIVDLFTGEVVNCWKDSEYVYVNFPWCCVNFPLENWDEVRKDLKKLSMVK
ncbi:MAG: hypothetical protein Q7R52_00125 [archaeon]|nr:hypothetical protein [archaeon]